MKKSVEDMKMSYLTFKIGEETFAANVSDVTNILEMTKITALPKTPEYLKGVINLRGSVLPVIDTKEKFQIGETEYTTNTCILVLDLSFKGERLQIGAIVDAVQEVLEIDKKQIQPPPTLGASYNSKFITGMVVHSDIFIMILDMNFVFTANETQLLLESQQLKEA